MLCRFCVDQNLLRRPSLSLSRSLKDKEMTSLARREILRRCFSASATSGGKKTVGFVGAGNMGKFMAKNLVEAGYAVRVFDVSSDAVNECVAFGAEAASSPASAAEGASTIVTMLPNSSHVRDAVIGRNGVLQTAMPGTLIIDSSTIDPDVTRSLAKEAKARQCSLIDAPVSGGVGGAEAGTLTFMVGGEDEDFTKSQDVLEAMGSNIVHCGGVGTGEVAKLCNNMILGISMIGVCEAMNMGVKLGMDPSKLAGILNTSTARCWSSDTYNPTPGVMENVPSSRDYQGGFGSALMLKDLGLATSAAEANGAFVHLGKTAQSMYEKLCEDEQLAGKDFSVVFKLLQESSDRNPME